MPTASKDPTSRGHTARRLTFTIPTNGTNHRDPDPNTSGGVKVGGSLADTALRPGLGGTIDDGSAAATAGTAGKCGGDPRLTARSG